MASVRFLPGAWDERKSLPTLELNAMNAAIRKLQLFGEQLPFPHQSKSEGPPTCESSGPAVAGVRGEPSTAAPAATSLLSPPSDRRPK